MISQNKWNASRSTARQWATYINLSGDYADLAASLFDDAIEFLKLEDVIGFAAITTIACAVAMASDLHYEHLEHMLTVHDARAKNANNKTDYRNKDTRHFLTYCAMLVGLLEDDKDRDPLSLDESIRISREALFASIHGDQKVIESARSLHATLTTITEMLPDQLRETSQQAVELIAKKYSDALKSFLSVEKFCTLSDILRKNDDDPIFGMCIIVAVYRSSVSRGYIPAHVQKEINEFSDSFGVPTLGSRVAFNPLMKTPTAIKGKVDISSIYPGNSMNN